MGWEKSRRRPQSGLASEGLPVSSGESPVCDEAAHFEALFSETQHGVGIPETRSALFLLTWNCACLSACTELKFSTLEVETGGSGVQGLPRLQSCPDNGPGPIHVSLACTMWLGAWKPD